jgi:hypothetical protein
VGGRSPGAWFEEAAAAPGGDRAKRSVSGASTSVGSGRKAGPAGPERARERGSGSARGAEREEAGDTRRRTQRSHHRAEVSDSDSEIDELMDMFEHMVYGIRGGFGGRSQRVRCVCLPARWVRLRDRWVTLGARWVRLRAPWVTLRARWVPLRARWVTLRARWVTLRAR